MSVFSLLFGPPKPQTPMEPYWQRNQDLKYARLIHMHARSKRLHGRGGVYVLWTLGVKGQWLFCGHTADMGEAVDALPGIKPIHEAEDRTEVLFTWSPIRAELRDGVVAYLRRTLSFEIQDDSVDLALGMAPGRIAAATPVPVLPPG